MIKWYEELSVRISTEIYFPAECSAEFWEIVIVISRVGLRVLGVFTRTFRVLRIRKWYSIYTYIFDLIVNGQLLKIGTTIRIYIRNSCTVTLGFSRYKILIGSLHYRTRKYICVWSLQLKWLKVFAFIDGDFHYLAGI